MKYVMMALIALMMVGCDVEESLNKAEKSLQETKKELEAKVAEEQITPQRPEPVEQVEQITPSRPTTGNVEVIEDTNTSNNYKAGEAITRLDADYGTVKNSLKVTISSVVHNSTTGNYSTSTGSYLVASIDVNGTKSVYVSTRPNCSIRMILSPFGVAETNAKIDRTKRGYAVHNADEVEIFTGRDPFGVVVNSTEPTKVYMYFAIDNDNTNSYFNKEKCELNVGVQ